MNKEEYIERRGGDAYERHLQQSRDWYAQHHEGHNAIMKKWRETHQDKVKVNNQECSRKGGKYYEKGLEYQRTGLQGERHIIRMKHGNKYRPFKQIIAPGSQIHHEWTPETAEYMGVALVEKDQHMHGYVDVIKVLEGKITLLTEKEIKEQGRE
ncbi:hypothetical protein KAW18_18360 [candidate division WOR-3 bacterium]|nr:hypothetical protein [candidate division WOR-3 bacterium]